MAKLTAARRKKIPAKDFSGPNRSFPIDTPNRARNALARASQFHPELKSKIKTKIHAKYPGIAMKMDGGPVHQRMDRASRRK